MNIKEIVSTEPIKTGTSNLFKASTISFPKPFHPNIYSTKTEPANILANQPDKAWIHAYSFALEMDQYG